MQVFDERDKPPCPTCQRKTATGPPVDWRASLWLLIIVGALVGLLLLATGCSPLRGPATSTARPEAGLSAITPAAEATTAELATVCTSTTAIRGEVAAMVPAVREAKAVAPVPAARIEAGHQTIYAAAQTAEAAAGQARQQVATITASAGQAEAELARYRQEVDAERAAWAKERQAAKDAEDSGLRNGAKWAMGIFGLIAAAGLALLFASPAARGMAVLLIVGGGAGLALASMVYKWAPLFPYFGIGLLLAAGAAGAWQLRRKEKREALLSDSLSGAVGFGEQLKATAPAESVDAAKAWAKANLAKPIRDELWNHLPTETRK